MGMHLLRDLHTLHSPPQMRAALRRERLRVDRNDGRMSVVVFEAPNATWWQLRRMARIVLKRCRCTDEVGWMSTRQIGAILADTGDLGASSFGQAVQSRAANSGLTVNVTVYVYPDNQQPRNGEPLDSMLVRQPRNESIPQCVGAERRGIELCDPQISKNRGIAVLPLQLVLGEPLPIWKRTMDIIGALAGLVIATPVMMMAALLVKLSSPGPTIFRQLRAGRGDSRFTIFKFRTMVSGAEALKSSLRPMSEQDGPAFKMRDDPRVTLIGRFLRATSLDELPQFWNVLVGNMSLVGPRPLPVDESNACDRWHRQRMDVVPGLTCIWQVRGRSRVKFDDWMRMDLEYIRHRSLLNDLKILLLTVPAVILRRGAH